MTDEPYLLAAARYVELNPVRARLVSKAGDWPSSSEVRLRGLGHSTMKKVLRKAAWGGMPVKVAKNSLARTEEIGRKTLYNTLSAMQVGQNGQKVGQEWATRQEMWARVVQ